MSQQRQQQSQQHSAAETASDRLENPHQTLKKQSDSLKPCQTADSSAQAHALRQHRSASDSAQPASASTEPAQQTAKKKKAPKGLRHQDLFKISH